MTDVHHAENTPGNAVKAQDPASPPITTLLDLPLEVLQHVFDFCTPASWLYFALSCRECYDLAGQVRPTLLYQLQRTPIHAREPGSDGAVDPYDDAHVAELKSKSTPQLFELLRERMVSYLLGAGLNVRTTLWRLVRPYETHKQKRVVGLERAFDDWEDGVVDGQIDVGGSTLRRTLPNHVRGFIRNLGVKHAYYMDFGLVRKDTNTSDAYSNGQVALYASRNDHSTSDWRDLGMIQRQDQVVPPYSHPCRTKVLKVLIDDSPQRTQLVSVLQHFSPEPAAEAWADDTTTPGEFCIEAFHLVHYIWTPESKGPYRVVLAMFPDKLGYRPVSVAVHSPYRVAVCWENVHDASDRTVAVHLSNHPADTSSPIEYLHYHEFCVIDKDGVAPFAPARRPTSIMAEPITYMRFANHGSQLLYHYDTTAIYPYFQTVQYNNDASTVSSTSRVYRNQSWAEIATVPPGIHGPPQDTSSASYAFQIAMPFYARHMYDTMVVQPRVCFWRYLAVGIPVDGQGRGGGGSAPKRVPCILRSGTTLRPSNCTHRRDLDRGRRFDNWTIVARLAGWPGAASDGGGGVSVRKIAYARNSTRIAIVGSVDNGNGNGNGNDGGDEVRVWNFRPHFFARDLTTPSSNPRQFRYPRSMMHSASEADGLTEGWSCVELEPLILRLRGSAAGARIVDLQFGHDGENSLFALTHTGCLFRWDFAPATVEHDEDPRRLVANPTPKHQEISLRFPNPPSFDTARKRVEDAHSGNTHTHAVGEDESQDQDVEIEDRPVPGTRDGGNTDDGSHVSSYNEATEDDVLLQLEEEAASEMDDDDDDDGDDLFAVT